MKNTILKMKQDQVTHAAAYNAAAEARAAVLQARTDLQAAQEIRAGVLAKVRENPELAKDMKIRGSLTAAGADTDLAAIALEGLEERAAAAEAALESAAQKLMFPVYGLCYQLQGRRIRARMQELMDLMESWGSPFFGSSKVSFQNNEICAMCPRCVAIGNVQHSLSKSSPPAEFLAAVALFEEEEAALPPEPEEAALSASAYAVDADGVGSSDGVAITAAAA